MNRPRRWWNRERNAVARAERREAVREAGSHRRWALLKRALEVKP